MKHVFTILSFVTILFSCTTNSDHPGISKNHADEIIIALSNHSQHFQEMFNHVYEKSSYPNKIEIKNNVDSLIKILEKVKTKTINNSQGFDENGMNLHSPFFVINKNIIEDEIIDEIKLKFDTLSKLDRTDHLKIKIEDKKGVNIFLLNNYYFKPRTALVIDMKTNSKHTEKVPPIYSERPERIHAYELITGIINLECEILKMATNILLEK